MTPTTALQASQAEAEAGGYPATEANDAYSTPAAITWRAHYHEHMGNI